MNTKKSNSLAEVISETIHNDISNIDLSIFEEYINMALQHDNYSFNKGLLGIGWFLAYLDNSNKISLDIDEILFDLDDNIYKLSIKEVVSTETNFHTLFDFISYFQQRFIGRNKNQYEYRKFAIHECLKLLMEKLLNSLNANYKSLPHFSLAEFLLKISFLGPTAYSVVEGEKIFIKVFDHLIDYYSQHKSTLSQEDIESLHLLLLSSYQFQNNYWATLIKDLLLETSSDSGKINILNYISSKYQEKKEILFSKIPYQIENDFLLMMLTSIKAIKI